jgi:hypothetical protein
MRTSATDISTSSAKPAPAKLEPVDPDRRHDPAPVVLYLSERGKVDLLREFSARGD